MNMPLHEQVSQAHGSKKNLLEGLVVCPSCGGTLRSAADSYSCRQCSREYPVIGGIPRFRFDLSVDEQQVKESFNLEHERYLDSRHVHFTAELIQRWLDDVKLPAEFFKDKLVLDAGCGSGRWTYAMAMLGAKVISVDFTDSGVAITHQATQAMENVAVVQASLFNLPLRPETFDFVLSWGVLHHTPDTKAAFGRIAPLVKRGGYLYIMVYEKHNPLKHACTDLIRWMLRHLPPDRRYRACRAFIIKNPRLYSLVAQVIICAPHPSDEDSLSASTLQLGLYDAYSPVFNHLHNWKEVAGWFGEYGFTQPTLTRPVHHTTKRDIRRLGECGGSVKMRGVRT